MILEILRQLAEALNLPSWTATNLQAAYDKLYSTPRDSSIQWSFACSRYQETLESDPDLSLLATAYSTNGAVTF
jgi:hypothetical protein